MNVLITGGTGFLGKALAYELKSLGYDISVMGRNQSICAAMRIDGFNVLKADIRQRDATINLARGYDVVVHCAALSSPWGRYQDFYQINVIGTHNIVRSCMEHNVDKLIHISTPSIYFRFADQINISENDPLPENQVNDYARTKLDAEMIIDNAKAQGLAVITMRPRGIFGPGDNAILPRLIATHSKRGLPLFREGRVLMDMTYVGNVVDAIVACIEAPSTAFGKKFNITNGEPMYFIDLLEKLFNRLNQILKTKKINYSCARYMASFLELIYSAPFIKKEPPITKYTLGLLRYHQTLDITRAKEELHYKPKITVEEGLDLFVNKHILCNEDKHGDSRKNF